MKDLSRELFRLRVEFDMIQRVYCSKAEEKKIKKILKDKQPLPEGLYTDNDGTHYRFVNTDISEEDKKELLLFRQLKYLKTIRDCMIFFVILAIIPIICAFFLLGAH